MNQNSGIYVFRNEDDTPVLIAYKKLPNLRYLTLVHFDNSIIAYHTSYSELLDIIPIHSVYIHAYLPTLQTRRQTIDKWYQIICLKMIDWNN